MPVTRQYEEGISSNRCLVRNGEDYIRDELTVCRWGGIRIGGNRSKKSTSIFFFLFFFPLPFYCVLKQRQKKTE